jgi:hypothetical protein
MTINIEWQDQHWNWHHYQTNQNQADGYGIAKHRAESTEKQYRLVGDYANLVEIINP